MTSKLFDSALFGESRQAFDFITNLLESSTEYSIIATGHDGRILLWNEGARRVYGYEPEEMIGSETSEILHTPEDRAAGKPAEIQRVALRDGKWEGTIERVRKNGERFFARVVKTPLRDGSGGNPGFLLISKDVSGELRLNEELKAAQYYTRSLIESNIDALMTTDPLGIITDVNRQMCEMTGLGRDELIGTPFKRYFTDPQRAEDGIRRVLVEDRVMNYELTMRSKSSKETVVSYNATTFRDAQGRLRGVFAAARDITDQKRLEENLRQVQNYTRGLIEASVDALVTVDPEQRISDVNEQTARLTGFTREELIGSAFPDYFTDPEAAATGVRRTLEEGFVTNYVLVLRSKRGTETPVSFNASVFRDTEGKIRGIFASARDITGQKRLEEELRQQQNYTRGLIESSVDAMITVDPDLTITDVNEQMVRLTEVTKDGLVGSRFERYFTEPDRAAEGVRLTLRQGYVTNYDLTLRTPSGCEVLVAFNASVYKDTAGAVRGIYAIARDVTEQRQLEEQLREQQNYSRGLIEASVDALVTVDPTGLITDVNEQMVRLTGYGRQQLVGKPFADFFTDPERALAGVRQTFAEGIVKNYELVAHAKAGVETIVSFNAAVFRDTAGKVAGIFAAARDITDQKALERQLREQQTYNRGLIDSNIDALMTTDILGVISDVNPQMCAVTGYGRDELIGTAFKEYFTDPQRAEEGIRRVLTEGRVTNYELTIRAKGGKGTVVSYNATTFTGEDGRRRGVFAAAREITDQKRLEEELRQAQNYNRGLIESSVDGMLTVDPELMITDVNEQMVRLSGYGRDLLIGSSFPDYFTEPERAAAGVRQTLAEGYVRNYELTLRSQHRRQILVSFNASVYKDTAGAVRGIYAIARDVTDQRRLEEQLRESQHYNRGLIESSVDALVTVDPDLTITDVNEQMVRLTGYVRDELVGSPFKDYFTEPERAAAGVRQTLAKGSVTNYELILRSKGGKRTVVSFNAGTFKDTEGKVAGILAAARDITEQRRLAEELRDQQTYNRGLIESSVDALMTVAPDGVITDVNEQTVRLIGYSRKQLVGGPFATYFTDPERATAGVKTTFAEGVVTNYELIVRTRSGRKVAVSFNAAVFRDTEGNVVGILAAARDITQHKQIEHELREQQAYTRSLIESNIDALMTTDPLGIITDVNRQMCAVTGSSREELIGSAFKDYFTEPQRAEEGIRRVLVDGRVTNYELTIRARDGREMVVSYNATTFTDADGRLRGVFAAARDITDQTRLEQQIQRKSEELQDQYRRVQEANRMKSEFLANMSHELRTPLNGIIGFSELIYDGKAGEVSPKQQKYVGHILNSSRHLLQLINDVLDLAKVESGKFEFQPERVDVAALVREVTDTLQSIAGKKRVRVETDIAPGLGEVVIDRGKLKQVVYNYLSNALKFTPDEGRVRVDVRPEDADHFRLEVVDTGIGIRKENLGRLFAEFQQLDATTAKKHQGTGLGLALTKRIVEAQGGRVGVESEFGKGSTFFAVLPRLNRVLRDATPVETDEGARAAPVDAAGRLTVLVIEDDARDRAWLATELSQAGYAVQPAATGHEALALLRQRRFDLISLDLLLPDVIGVELLREIRADAQNHDTPVIVVSVVAEKSVVEPYLIVDYLVKPVGAEDLRAALRRAGLLPDQSPPVLVIDDDPAALRYAEELLGGLGYRPICRADGASALLAVADTRPRAVLLDLLMPGMDGFEFLERFRRAPGCGDVPVIIWTVKDLSAAERELLRERAQGIVAKAEGTPTELLALLQRYVRPPGVPDDGEKIPVVGGGKKVRKEARRGR